MTLPAVSYTATRSLHDAASGATVDYSIPVAYAGMSRRKQVLGTERISLSRLREMYVDAKEDVYSIQTIPLDAEQAARFRQFADSVDEGESFQFDPDGGGSSTAYLQGVDYEEVRSGARDDLVSVAVAIAVPR